jgi:xanthine dehydrogenase iron-sulfur cluster and FAD-binding subunit A
MSASQRTKGQGGEREAAHLLSEITGQAVTRRVRQHAGDADLIGLPGWAVEVKRARAVSRAVVAAWWEQACRQAAMVALFAGSDCRPLLLYRQDRQPWRAVWADDDDHAHPVEAEPTTWWRVAQRAR